MKRCRTLSGLFFVLLMICLLTLPGKPAHAQFCLENRGEDKKRLSKMNDEELQTFFETYVDGAEIILSPEGKEICFQFLKHHIRFFDAEGRTPVFYNWIMYHNMARAIDRGIEKYYEGKFQKSGEPEIKAAAYVPQQNEFYLVPANMSSFNCYGYAVGNFNNNLWPGFANGRVIHWGDPASLFAAYVKEDLQSVQFNQNCVRTTTSRPASSILSSGLNAMCIRTGSSSYAYDYHLMRLTSSGWYHKPGDSAILKHIVPHSPSVSWLNEVTYDGVNWILGDLVYSGPVWYIIYRPNHSYSLEYTGNHYHSGAFHFFEKAYICNNCGESYGAYYEKRPCAGPPCEIPFSMIGDEDRNNLKDPDCDKT